MAKIGILKALFLLAVIVGLSAFGFFYFLQTSAKQLELMRRESILESISLIESDYFDSNPAAISSITHLTTKGPSKPIALILADCDILQTWNSVVGEHRQYLNAQDPKNPANWIVSMPSCDEVVVDLSQISLLQRRRLQLGSVDQGKTSAECAFKTSILSESFFFSFFPMRTLEWMFEPIDSFKFPLAETNVVKIAKDEYPLVSRCHEASHSMLTCLSVTGCGWMVNVSHSSYLSLAAAKSPLIDIKLSEGVIHPSSADEWTVLSKRFDAELSEAGQKTCAPLFKVPHCDMATNSHRCLMMWTHRANNKDTHLRLWNQITSNDQINSFPSDRNDLFPSELLKSSLSWATYAPVREQIGGKSFKYWGPQPVIQAEISRYRQLALAKHSIHPLSKVPCDRKALFTSANVNKTMILSSSDVHWTDHATRKLIDLTNDFMRSPPSRSELDEILDRARLRNHHYLVIDPKKVGPLLPFLLRHGYRPSQLSQTEKEATLSGDGSKPTLPSPLSLSPLLEVWMKPRSLLSPL